MSQCAEEMFLRDIATHEMTILRDDSVNRHVQFKRPGTRCCQFDLITWPGYLCYCGDMGTYVFSRLNDMFEFFRTDRRDKDNPEKLFINLGYWAEKIQATDRSNGHEEFSQDKFRRVIEGYLEDASDDLRQAVQNEVLSRIYDGEHAAFQAAHDFEHGDFYFSDFWDHSFRECTYQFIWCCYAIAYGVREYDKATAIRQPIGERV